MTQENCSSYSSTIDELDGDPFSPWSVKKARFINEDLKKSKKVDPPRGGWKILSQFLPGSASGPVSTQVSFLISQKAVLQRHRYAAYIMGISQDHFCLNLFKITCKLG